MSYVYRYEKIPQGRKLQLENFSSKKYPNGLVIDHLSEPIDEGEEFDVLIVRSCSLKKE